MKSRILLSAAVLSFLFLSTGCADEVNPAGFAEYENPAYPSELLGFASIPAQFSGGFFYNDRVYVLESVNDYLISFSITDRGLILPDTPVVKDTLSLGVSVGSVSIDPVTGTLFISDNITNDVYRLFLGSPGSPELVCHNESVICGIYSENGGNSIIICNLGPEWIVRKVDTFSGEVQMEFETSWPITRSAISVDGSRLLLSNSAKNYLIEIETGTFQQTDSIPLPERCGPFIYNISGDIVVFNQYTIFPRVYLVNGISKDIMDVVECINPYKICCLMPGTDVVLAPRRSDNKVSVLNSANMIFAPSIYCFTYPKILFPSTDGEYIIVMSSSPGRAYVYSYL